MASSLCVRSSLVALLGLTISLARAHASPQASPTGPHAAAVGSPVPLGERPSWSEFALPADFQGPGSVYCLGTSMYFQTPTHVYLWSSITSRWTVLAVSATAQVTQFNDYITILDGPTVHAYATRTGVATLRLPATPQLLNGSPSSNWLSIAVLGTEAWAFGAFDGQWHHRQLAGPPANVTISSTTGVFTDGVSVYGVSAYHGEIVAAPIPAGATLTVGGDVAVARTASAIAGFSAHTGRWESIAAANANPLVVERGYAMYADASDLIAFSACTGDFVRRPIAAGYSFSPGRYVAAVRVGNDVLGYSSGQNTFALRTFASTPAVTVDDEVLAVSDVVGVTAFSVVTGAFSAMVPGTYSLSTNDAMVWIDDQVQRRAYCSITGKWVAPPIAPGATVQTVLMRNVVVLADAQGYHAFSGRTGEWVSQSTTTPFAFTGPNTSDLFAAFDGTRTRVFDPILARWATIQTTSPIQSHDLWRQTLVGFDGQTAVGFSLLGNGWKTTAVQGNFARLDANDAAGFVLTDSHAYGYAAHGSLSTLSRYPEFSRLQPIGVPLRLTQVAPPGSFVTAILARESTYRPTPFGTLFLDPATVFARVPLGIVPAEGVLDVPLDLSQAPWSTSVPGLRGSAVHVQTRVKPPLGATQWLSNAIAPVLL